MSTTKKRSSEQKAFDDHKRKIVLETNEKLFNILFVEDELSWKDVIYSLIDSEQMDPWDIDLSIIAQKFLEMLNKLKEMDFRISGKMVLAAAILLKMKSERLIEEDIAKFDNVLNNIEENFPDTDSGDYNSESNISPPQIVPRTPQPRKRKVSVFDLVKALEKALEVDSRRKKVVKGKKITAPIIPEKKFDLGKSMDEIYSRIEKHYSGKLKKNTLTFDNLVLSYSKRDKVLTFVPLLHLESFRKVDLEQNTHFDPIVIKLAKGLTKAEEEKLIKLLEESTTDNSKTSTK